MRFGEEESLEEVEPSSRSSSLVSSSNSSSSSSASSILSCRREFDDVKTKEDEENATDAGGELDFRFPFASGRG